MLLRCAGKRSLTTAAVQLLSNSLAVSAVQNISSGSVNNETIDALEKEGMPREQAEKLLELIDDQIDAFKSDFYEHFVHPHDYYQVISTLRHAQPTLLSDSQLLTSHTHNYTTNQLSVLDSQTAQHRLELQRTYADVKASLQLDVSLERKRLEEVEATLTGKAKEGAEYAEGKVEECRQLSDELWKRTSTSIASIGTVIITLFFIYNSVSI